MKRSESFYFGRMAACSVGAALLALALTAKPAFAEEAVSSDVLVVLASEQAGTIDPALAKIPALGKSPFNAFRTMQVLSRSEVSLTVGKAVEVTLPNGRILSLTLEERMPDGRSKVQVLIKRPNQKDHLLQMEVNASPGEPFFVAGQNFQNGTLVIGVTVGKRPEPPPPAKKK
jgi:hypothetical protein